jgi:dienelactone hydrolase
MVGTSRGGELALQLGSMYPQIGAVVAYVPASVRVRACCGMTAITYAWTWKGQPLAYVMRPAQRGGAGGFTAAIAVENTRGPVLMISGESDHVWPSAEMADEVVSRLRRNHFPFSCENLKYRGAGHDAGQPGFVPAWHGTVRNPTSGQEMDLGGSPAAEAASVLEAMPKVLAFLRQSLP